MAERCRCGLPVKPPSGPHWVPGRDVEPGPQVRAVALYGQDPGLIRRVRAPGGWHTEGAGAAHPESTPPGPWQRTGQCWAQVAHTVVDVTDFVAWVDGAGTESSDVVPAVGSIRRSAADRETSR